MNYSLAIERTLPLRRIFYLVSQSESTYDSLESIPDFVTESIPFFVLMIIIEYIIISRKNSKYTGIDWSDSISSMTAGILSQLPSLTFKSVEIISYIWIHKHFSVISMPRDSILVWIFGMVGVEFGYYWIHRAGHEISLFWSYHQAHHSSQRYNLTTALRQGVFQKYYSWMFYIPLAFFLPPTVFVVHLQFNLLYQFWIHTEVVGRLGPLELIINTPSHHRVHHGRNKYCIDKNYGGTLIIFDRIFGTFQQEEDKVVYGHVHPIESWNPIEIQIIHLKYIFQQFLHEKSFKNKLKILYFGPGWKIGTNRLGSPDDIPELENPVKYYQKYITPVVFIYCLLNFITVLILYSALATFQSRLPTNQILIGIGVIGFTLIQIGRLLDGTKLVWSECTRIIIGLGIILKFSFF